jgi:NADH:ubiquinone oxidoreductase subunit 3 (subunit A)
MDYPMNNTYLFVYALCILQIYLAVRYVVKAVMRDVENYNIFKLIMVLVIPIFGYYYATKEEVPVS